MVLSGTFCWVTEGTALEPSSSSRASLQQLFSRGCSDEVLSLTVDQAFGPPIAPEHWPFVIGALCFKGRTDEAEIRFQTARTSLPMEALVACQFYLGIGFARLSNYSKARSLFVANLRLLRQQKTSMPVGGDSSTIRFYVWQGIGFFRQLCGQRSRAKVAAQKAWQASIEANDYFGRMLATELYGHSLIGCGQIARGLRELATAFGLAQNLGHGAYEKAVYRSLIMYKIQFGYPPYDALQTVRELLRESRVANNYSDNALSLELIRQLILRGELPEASKLHDDIGRSIYAERHRRHEIFWHLQAAEIAWLRRQTAAFRQALVRAETALEPEFDQALQLHILGLKMREEASSVSESCRRLTRRLGSDIGARMLARQEGKSLDRPLGEDPLGDILDALSSTETTTRQKLSRVLESPYLGLLARLLPDVESPQALHILVPEGVIIIVDHGAISRADAQASPQTLDLLRLLSQGWVQKEQLVESIWGYAYHPLKHDSLVYSLISRVRTQLGTAGLWIEHSADGYCLRPGVRLLFQDFGAQPLPAVPANLDPLPAFSSLNARQVQMLEALKTRASMNVEDCVQLFAISKITASRDLSSLCQEGLVQRLGKGRATQYRLHTMNTQV